MFHGVNVWLRGIATTCTEHLRNDDADAGFEPATFRLKTNAAIVPDDGVACDGRHTSTTINFKGGYDHAPCWKSFSNCLSSSPFCPSPEGECGF